MSKAISVSVADTIRKFESLFPGLHVVPVHSRRVDESRLVMVDDHWEYFVNDETHFHIRCDNGSKFVFKDEFELMEELLGRIRNKEIELEKEANPVFYTIEKIEEELAAIGDDVMFDCGLGFDFEDNAIHLHLRTEENFSIFLTTLDSEFEIATFLDMLKKLKAAWSN